MFESYEGSDNVLSASLGTKRIYNFVGVVNYIKPFDKNDTEIITANAIYYTGTMFDYMINYRQKKQNNVVNEYYSAGLKLSVDKLF